MAPRRRSKSSAPAPSALPQPAESGIPDAAPASARAAPPAPDGPISNDAAFIALYDTLRAAARRHMRSQSPQHTLTPTALVNEAYLRMASHRGAWSDRLQFLAVAARAMRSALVDHARRRGARKRKSPGRRVSSAVLVAYDRSAIDVLALDEALRALLVRNPGAAQAIELRYFGGLTAGEISQVLGSSLRSVERDLSFARAWLHAALTQEERGRPG